MALRRMILQFCAIFILVSVSGIGKSDGIRLCGRKLADLLKFICEKHGGFHAPLIKKDGPHPSHRQLSSDSRVFRRSDVIPFFPETGEILSTWQKGVVDECCKKQCPLTTLVSYCADANYIGPIDIDEILSSLKEHEQEPEPKHFKQATPQHNPMAVVQPMSPPHRPAYSRRPNLGLSNRDRSVFIVSPQLQDGDQALGEYRF